MYIQIGMNVMNDAYHLSIQPVLSRIEGSTSRPREIIKDCFNSIITTSLLRMANLARVTTQVVAI